MTTKIANLNDIQKQINSLQKQIDYDTRDFPIEYIVTKFLDKSYKIPNYQRKVVWSQHQKERFIESLLLGYPIPLIFLSELSDGKLEIVDGVQRITTLTDFLTGNLMIQKLEKLTLLKHCQFNDLPLSEQRKLNAKSLRVIVLSEKTEQNTRSDLFDRLNTSAEPANPSEIRNGKLNENKFQRFINKLADSNLFSDIVKLSENKIKRQENVELVSRFFAYSNNYKNFSHSVKNFVTEYIDSTGESWTREKKSQLNEQFETTFLFAKKYFKSDFLNNSRNQTPRVRFEALLSGINLALQQKPNLKSSIDITNKLLSNEKFKIYTTSDGSNSSTKVRNRIEFVRDFLLNGDSTND